MENTVYPSNLHIRSYSKTFPEFIDIIGTKKVVYYEKYDPTNMQSSKIIESVFLNLNIYPVYFGWNKNYNNVNIYSGRHVIQTFHNFVLGNIIIDKLDFFTSINKMCYMQLPPQFKRKLSEFKIDFTEIFTISEDAEKSIINIINNFN